MHYIPIVLLALVARVSLLPGADTRSELYLVESGVGETESVRSIYVVVDAASRKVAPDSVFAGVGRVYLTAFVEGAVNAALAEEDLPLTLPCPLGVRPAVWEKALAHVSVKGMTLVQLEQLGARITMHRMEIRPQQERHGEQETGVTGEGQAESR